MVVPLLTKHPAWDGASPCPAAIATINAAAIFHMAMAMDADGADDDDGG